MSILASQWHRCRTILTQVPVRSIRIQPRPGGKTNGFHPRKVIQEMSVSPEKNQVLKPFLFTVGVCTTSYIGATLWQYEDLRSSGKLIFQANRESLAEWIGRQKRGRFREEVHQWWNSVPANEKVFYPILFLNAVVFLAWKVKRWHIPMTEWFCANPVGTAVHSLGQEQFLGLYISGGVVASFMSHLHKVATNQKVLSLGASGAILSIFAFMCCQMPNSKLELVFLPGFSFTAQTALMGAIGLDVAGLLFRWKLFDHAAHLGGSLFGFFWYKYGDDIWSRRGPIIRWWHDLRENFNNR
ncbi:hypothetical protein QYM36_009446 [Artemia franciscana]|uniref:rhomboid protease n=1 Tax=Artemia franciscana TaxID=6661 RepID=A0AA88HQY1_ARTSF|nr:hypothetical protein QYM36_009446 [Artemia franciscana]